MFKREEDYIQWNEENSGQFALMNESKGYLEGSLLGKTVKAHRILWQMEFNEIPNIVDHINSIRSDNRIVNLRNVDLTENNRNLSMPKTNTSGVIGVSYSKSRGKWQAKIWNENKCIFLGRFDDFEKAVEVRKEAEIFYGYHENHGKKVINV